jgi:serine/threonine-protein kinase
MNGPSSGEIGVGTVIAETYECTRLIGQGGMGAVFEATHRRLPGKRVAVKVLLNASTEGEALARFRREAEIASKLGHPNIIEVLDFHTLPSGTPYMILEFLEGESLARRLKQGPIPVDKALDIVRQVGSALHAAHREGVVHRDLKPDNIFLVPTDSGGVISERVKVLDFGISKIRGSSTVQTQESALLGTPQYMSPEQAFGKNKTIDNRTDIWALGAIVFEMLTGHPAFTGDTLAQVILAIVHEEAPSLVGAQGVPEHVARAVQKALQKEPDARFAEVHELVAAMTGRELQTLDRRAAVSGSGNMSASPPATTTGARGEVVVPPTEQVRPPSKMGLIAGVLGVLLAGGGVAAFMVLKHNNSDTPKDPPKVDAPKVETAAKVDPPKVEAPKAEAPKAEAPKAEAPKAEAPKAEAPKAEAPKVEAKAGADKKTADKHKAEVIPPAVAADLQAAEAALGKNDPSNAIHLARRTLTTQATSKAHSIITRGFCLQGDLGNAKASFRSVTGSERAIAIKACKKNEIDLP